MQKKHLMKFSTFIHDKNSKKQITEGNLFNLIKKVCIKSIINTTLLGKRCFLPKTGSKMGVSTLTTNI